MKRMVMALIGLGAALALGAADLKFTTGGDRPWTQSGDVWTSGDLAAIGSGYLKTWLDLKVEGPCTVTFDAAAYPRSNTLGSSLECSVNDSRLESVTFGFERGEPNTVLIPESGESVIRWFINTWDGFNWEWYADFKIGNVKVEKAPSAVTVRFDANGGSMEESDTVNFETGVQYGTLPEPTRGDYTFAGWFTARFGGEQIRWRDYVRFDVETLYARWTLPLAAVLLEGGGIEMETSEGEWYGQPDDSHDGNGCAAVGKSGNLAMTVFGTGTLNFWWKTVGGAICWVRDDDALEELASFSAPGSVFDPLTGKERYPDSEWQHASVMVVGEGEHCLTWSKGWFNNDNGGSAFLLDELTWTPAPEAMTVMCFTGKNESSAVGCVPGDTFAKLTEPTRSGYVFGGWFYDTAFMQQAESTALVPFDGTTVFAKWCRTLASATTAGLEFTNNPNASEMVQFGFYQPSDWELVERTYDDGADVFQAALGKVEDGWLNSTLARMETTVTGSCFLDFVWNLTYGDGGFAFGTLYVDGKESASIDPFLGDSSTVAVRVALGEGSHTVAWEAAGVGSATVEGIETSKITSAKGFGEWYARLKKLDCWTKGNLTDLQSAYAPDLKSEEPAVRCRAAIEHAFCTLFALGEDKLVTDTLAQFGYKLDFIPFGVTGKFTYSRAPALNPLADQAVAKMQAAVDVALNDLNLIPEDWTGTVKLSADEYPVDEDVLVDIGDVLYLKSALKGALGAAYWVKAYNTTVDWKKLESDLQGPKIATGTAAPVLGSDANWGAPIEFCCGSLVSNHYNDVTFDPVTGELSFEDVLTEGGRGTSGSFNAVLVGKKLYVRVLKGDILGLAAVKERVFQLELRINDGKMSSDKDVRLSCDYYPEVFEGVWAECSADIAGRESSKTLEADFSEDESAYMVVIDLTGCVLATDTTLRMISKASVSVWTNSYDERGSSIGGMTGEAEYESGIDRRAAAVVGQTTMMDKVRNEAALAKSRELVRESLGLAQRADGLVLKRTGDATFLINYDAADAERLEAMRGNVANALASLDGEAMPMDVEKGVPESAAAWFAGFANPLDVRVGALFEGGITRALLPQFTDDSCKVVILNSMPDPTLAGLLPSQTTDDWAAVLEARGLRFKTNPEIEVDAANVSCRYDGTAHKAGITVLVPASGAKVQYRTAPGAAWTTTVPSFTAEGIYTVDYKVTATDYADCLGQYTVTILPQYEFTVDEKGAITGVEGIFTGTLVISSDITGIAEGVFGGKVKAITVDPANTNFTVAGKALYGASGETLILACTDVTRIDVPASCTRIHRDAFLGCKSLKEVHFAGPVPTADDGLYADCTKVTTYGRSANGWGKAVTDGTWLGRPAKIEVNVEITVDGTGGTVSSSGGLYLSGTKLTLKATAEKGWVFAGWEGLPEDGDGLNLAALNPSVPCLTGVDDMEISANFLRVSEDWLYIEDFEDVIAYELGEEVTNDRLILELVDSGSLPTITVKDLPTGLKFDAKTGLISGRPTRKEYKFVTVSAKNVGGYAFTRVLRMSVGGAEEPHLDEISDYVDLHWLEGVAHTVGYPIEEHERIPQEYAVTISGLPTGLAYDSKAGRIVGTPTKPGVYTVKASMKDPTDRSKTLKGEYHMVVYDVGSSYIEVESGEGGTASGSGVYAAGSVFKPTAKAANGFVFAGWVTYSRKEFDGEHPLQQEHGADWRNPSQSWIAGDLPTIVKATFVAKSSDAEESACRILLSEDESWTADASDEDAYFYFAVASKSLPKITVKGLPAGITFGGEKDCVLAAQNTVFYRLKADSAKPPKPGFYTAEISAENQSKAKAVPVGLAIYVPNWRSDLIHVEEDYGEFTPGAEMKPIDLNGAVDSWDGVTLKVEGLPKGMTWNAAARTITGKTAVPGKHTVTFTLTKGSDANRVTAQATATFIVLPYPALAVTLADDAEGTAAKAGCKVTGGGNYPSGTRVTLKATAAKGWVFAGWEGLPDGFAGDWRNPSLAVETGAEDRDIQANFIRVSEDGLSVGDSEDVIRFALGGDVGEPDLILRLVDSGSLPTITVKDLPTGLKFDAKTGLISGKPTREEYKFVTVSAKNAGGYTFTRVLRMAVGEAVEPGKREVDGWVDLAPLKDFYVGYPVDPGGPLSEEYTVTVSGLPTGLKFDSKTQMVTGTPTKPGVYTVKATMKCPNSPSTTLTSEFRSIVYDTGSRYIEVASGEGGTASGSGVYAAGSVFKPTVKAANGFVFAGWVDCENENRPFQQMRGADWRNPSQSWIVSDMLPRRIGSAFVAKSEGGECAQVDTLCRILADPDWYADVSEEGDQYFCFAVESASLPKITVKGLPTGITFGGEKDCEASGNEKVVWYRLKADSAKPPKPGLYDVTISAENQSRVKAEPMTVTIQVPNWQSEIFDGLEYDEPYCRMIGVDPQSVEGIAFSVEEGWAVTASGLPSGMKFAFDRETSGGTVSGVPTKAGNYTVILTAKKGGETKQASVIVAVEPLPDALVGTFNGLVYEEGIFGAFALTSGKDGKITAKATRNGETVIWTASGWTIGADAYLILKKSGRKSGCDYTETLTLYVDPSCAWDGWQLSGQWSRESGGCEAGDPIPELMVEAQRNPFGKVGSVYENPGAHAMAVELSRMGAMSVGLKEGDGGYVKIEDGETGVSSVGQLKFTVKDTGIVSVAGKIGTLSVSASSTLLVIGGNCTADLCLIVNGKQVRISASFDGEGVADCLAIVK